MEKIIESEEYTEVTKTKGRSYHEHFQSYLMLDAGDASEERTA